MPPAKPAASSRNPGMSSALSMPEGGGANEAATCGQDGAFCPPNDYPVCVALTQQGQEQLITPQDGYLALSRLMMWDTEKDGKPDVKARRVPFGEVPESRYRSPRLDDPQTPGNEDEIRSFLKYHVLKAWDYEKGGLCRSTYTGDQGDPYRWYVYKAKGGLPTYMAFWNEAREPAALDPRESDGFYLSVFEVQGLVSSLLETTSTGENVPLINDKDFKCRVGTCAKEKPGGGYTSGLYLFTEEPARLEKIIAKLKDPQVAIAWKEKDPSTNQEKTVNFDAKRRLELTQHLEAVLKRSAKKIAEKQGEFTESARFWQAFGGVMSMLFMGAVGYPQIKQFLKRTQFVDAEERIRKILKADPTYDIFGRDQIAEDIWHMTDMYDPLTGELQHRGVIINAPTREGKDFIVEKMILMKVRGDEAVPEKFRDAQVRKIAIAELISDSKYRGSVADKVKEIKELASKRPIILWISEIDKVFEHGRGSEGSSEEVAGLLLDTLEEPDVKENLIILGTTSRGEGMLASRPDLQGRFNWPVIERFTTEQAVEVLRLSYERRMRAGNATLEMQPETFKTTFELVEHFVRPRTQEKDGKAMPPFPAVNKTLSIAATYAKETGSGELTSAHVLAAAESISGQTIDRTQLSPEIRAAIERDEQRLQQEGRSVRPAASPGGRSGVSNAAVEQIVRDIKSSHPQFVEKLGRNPDLILRRLAQRIVANQQQGKYDNLPGHDQGKFTPEALRWVVRSEWANHEAVIKSEADRDARGGRTRWEQTRDRFRDAASFVSRIGRR